MSFPRCSPVLITISLLALMSALPASAKVFTFDELNCRCEVPDTWVFQDAPGDLVDVVDIGRQRSFSLRVKPISRSIFLGKKEFIQAFEDGIVTRGFDITDRKNVVLQGFTFYEISMSKDLGNKMLYENLFLNLADGHCYIMELSSYTPKPDMDDELKTMVWSFNFLKPPFIHVPINGLVSLYMPPDANEHTTGYMVILRIIITAILFLLFAVPVAVVGGIIYGIYRLIRKSKRTD